MKWEGTTHALRAALERAHQEGISVTRIDGAIDPNTGEPSPYPRDEDNQIWLATSAGHGVWTYQLHLHGSANGVFISCDCVAGGRGLHCKHMARVLEAAGFVSVVPAGMAISDMFAAAEPAPAIERSTLLERFAREAE